MVKLLNLGYNHHPFSPESGLLHRVDQITTWSFIFKMNEIKKHTKTRFSFVGE